MYLLTETVSPFALERWAAFFANFGQFAKGFLYTLGISIGALIVALLLGLIFGAMSSTHNKVLRGISRVYVEIFQNTPLLVQFVVVFYGISILTDGNVMIPTSLTAILCVGVYTGAYISEIIRTGIEAIPKGQTEAALSQGFTYADTMRIIKTLLRLPLFLEQISCSLLRLGLMIQLTTCPPLLGLLSSTLSCVSL